MFLGGEEREAVTWPERVLRVAFLFFVLLNTSTYTANLAAFFTKSGVTLHGPKDMQELSRARACGVWDEDTKYFGPYVGETVNSGVSYLGANVNFEALSKQGFEVCLDKLKENLATATKKTEPGRLSCTPAIGGSSVDGCHRTPGT